MIEARELIKLYERKAAMDHLPFTVEPGRVTGFLGPDGAGKSTTMRRCIWTALLLMAAAYLLEHRDA